MGLIKTREEIERITESGRILSTALRKLKSKAAPGVSLIDLDTLARNFIKDAGAEPAFLGYRPDGARTPYPFTLCTSVNDVIVHGRPSSYQLKSGDILKLDLGVNWQGGITDAAVTIPIGKVSKDGLRLIKITKNALTEATRAAQPGNTSGDIGFAVERTVTRGGAKVVEGLTGHGVGTELHEEPIVFNYGQPGSGLTLKEGMVLALEPMTSWHTGVAVQNADDSFVTADGGIAVHFEHTLVITENGSKVLT